MLINPLRNKSFIQISSSSIPFSTLVWRMACRLACAASSTGASLLAFCSFFSAFSSRLESQAVTQSGSSASLNKSVCAAYKNKSPNPCLHGNFRLGHEHLNATFFVSTTVWYGVFPLPWQCPQMARSLCSSNTHLAFVAKPFPAFTEAASGANCMICSSVRFNNIIILVSY